MDEYKVCAATPAASLEEQIRSRNVPKNEREWWAKRHIDYLYEVVDERNKDVEALREQLATVTNERDELVAALKLWQRAAFYSEESELDEYACYCVPMPLFCDADEATEAALAKVGKGEK